MKIAVGIPSHQEADSIGRVVKNIDEGLCLLSGKYPTIDSCAIFNMDSSTDGTKTIFNGTKTINKKISIAINGRNGKGKGILKFFKTIANKHIDAALTIDADITSIKPSWVVDMISPILDRSADFVYPLYQRSRYEGSTTNHFAYPLIYSLFGKDVRQPIAGDFAYSNKMISLVSKSEIPLEAIRYGIDIFLTLTAVRNNCNIQPTPLDQKIHKPSFNKMEKMFPEVAATFIDMIRKIDFIPLKIEPQDDTICITNKNLFTHKKSALSLLDRNIECIANPTNEPWLENIKLHALTSDQPIQNMREWSKLLANWVIYAKKYDTIDSTILSKKLLPFFIVRTIIFWLNIENYESKEIEDAIRKQAKMTRGFLISHR